MRVKPTSVRDFWSGILFTGIGGAGIVTALHYPAGTLSRMGPGYFPLALSGILALTGLIFLARSLVVEAPPPAGFRPVAMLCVLGGVAAFAGLVDILGLAPTSLLLIVITYLGGREFSWQRMLALGFGMSAFVVVLFILLLKMQFRIGPVAWS